MNAKKIALALALAISAAAASANTNIGLSNLPDGSRIGSFSGSGISESFDFNANLGDMLNIASVSSNYFTTIPGNLFASGYHITSVFFDGFDILAAPISGASSTTSNLFSTNLKQNTDTWSFSVANLTSGMHTIQINGLAQLSPGTAGFIGNIQISPVPEPETYAMLLGGLVLTGAFIRRRRQG